VILSRDQLRRLVAILDAYRDEPITRPTIELALRLAKEVRHG